MAANPNSASLPKADPLSRGPSAKPFARLQTRVFLITHEFHPRHGGIATFTEEIARAAMRQGYDMEVWAPAAPAAAEKPWPFRLRRLPLKGTHGPACLLSLMRELIAHRRRLRDAIVYLPEPGPILAMMFLQFIPAFRPRHLVLTFYGSELLRFHRNPLTRLLVRRLIRRAVRVSVMTGYVHDLLFHRHPEAAAKVVFTPGALRSDFLPRSPMKTTATRGERMVILTVARLHPRKGQLFVIEALDALPPEVRERIEYWLVGGNGKENYEARLREAAGRRGLAVRFFGDVPVDELNRLYAQADIFALTSVRRRNSVEAYGLVYLEAGAHGLPVVGHSVGGVAEAVADGVTGLLVPPGDRPALTAAFARLISDPELRHRMGAAGRMWAQNNSWAHSAELLFGDIGLSSSD